MMKQMETLADNGEFQNILEGVMEQLTSKDILYEPIKDLAQKVGFIPIFLNDMIFFLTLTCEDVFSEFPDTRNRRAMDHKYPQWLKENKNKVSQEEYARYKNQSEYVQKIVAHYVAADYDEN